MAALGAMLRRVSFLLYAGRNLPTFLVFGCFLFCFWGFVFVFFFLLLEKDMWQDQMCAWLK